MKEFFSFIAGILCCGFVMYIVLYDRPSAMDVYRGKTTLEFTYKDSVAIDSTVVFKNEK